MERELLATKDYLNTVFNSIHDAVFVHDEGGRVVDVNDKMLDMYKLTREEAIGLSIIPDYVTPEGSPDLPAIWKKVMAGEHLFHRMQGQTTEGWLRVRRRNIPHEAVSAGRRLCPRQYP